LRAARAVKELHSEYLSKVSFRPISRARTHTRRERERERERADGPLALQVKRVVVYGSTSRYIVNQPDEEVPPPLLDVLCVFGWSAAD
jgi:hypothetical protein